jgi:transmembrane sensor
MIDEKILLAITSELTGQAQDDELDYLKDWLSESKENARIYHSYKEAFLNGRYKMVAKNTDTAYQKLSEALHFKSYDHASANASGKILRPHRRFDWFKKYAAILLILITTSIIIYKASDMWHTGNEFKIDHELIVKSNPRGVKSLIVLPDGSRVKLNSESHLEYYSDFDQERSVKLIGEAFFEVERDEQRPFTVKSGDLSVNVLGTSFNVKAFPFEEHIKVALVSGKVSVEKHAGLEKVQLQELIPGEMLVYNYQNMQMQTEPFDYNLTVAWKDGALNFKEVGFDEVVKILERWYGVAIDVKPGKDMSGKYTGFYKDESLDMILEGLGFAYEFEFEIHGKKVTIH